jgi:hypothetical protein
VQECCRQGLGCLCGTQQPGKCSQQHLGGDGADKEFDLSYRNALLLLWNCLNGFTFLELHLSKSMVKGHWMCLLRVSNEMTLLYLRHPQEASKGPTAGHIFVSYMTNRLSHVSELLQLSKGFCRTSAPQKLCWYQIACLH